MPPHRLHAGPRARPARRAGTTGGVSVRASAAARVVAGCEPATVGTPGVLAAACGASAGDSPVGAALPLGPPWPPLDPTGPAVSEATDVAASWAILRAR